MLGVLKLIESTDSQRILRPSRTQTKVINQTLYFKNIRHLKFRTSTASYFYLDYFSEHYWSLFLEKSTFGRQLKTGLLFAAFKKEASLKLLTKGDICECFDGIRSAYI
jgi:hypothetical protein